jgi:glutamine synthetase
MGFAADPDPDGRGHDAKRLPSDLVLALDGLAADSAYLAPVFPPPLLESWAAAKGKDAAYVRAAPVPQEYELYF